ncbi:MAG: hypothetical protein HOB77_06830 [Campylobacteraceae bacterium]|jgi:hypothetical protein|nr:hypothetical protein [Campylobacteraceae bacterium]
MQKIEYYVILNNEAQISEKLQQKLSNVEVLFLQTKMPFSNIEIDIYVMPTNKKECEDFIKEQDEDIRKLFKIEQIGCSIQYTAFIDILGFSNFIKHNIQNDFTAEEFHNDLKDIIEYLKFEKDNKDNIENAEYLNNISLKYTWVSDTFVITMNYEKEIEDNINIVKTMMLFKVSMMVSSISHFIVNKYGLLIRGAISYKYSCITDNLILGEGISEAATLEKIANVPRVIFEQSIICDDIYEIISRRYRDNNLNYISKDTDGYYFVNYLAMLQYIPPMIGKTFRVSGDKLKDFTVKKIDTTLNQYHKIANDGIESNISDAKLMTKYTWFKQYLENVSSSVDFKKNIIENLEMTVIR